MAQSFLPKNRYPDAEIEAITPENFGNGWGKFISGLI